MEALISSITAEGPEAKRPPHMEFEPAFDWASDMNAKTPDDRNGKTAATKKAKGLSTGVLVALAMAVGGALGLAGVYVSGGFERNGMSAATGDGGQCTVDDALLARLETLTTGDIAAMAVRSDPVAVGDLSFRDADGDQLTLAQTGDGYRLVNLWATWCAPCREEMPWLDQLQAEKGNDAFKVVAISVDGGSDEKPKAFYDEIGIETLTYYQDPTIDVFNRLKREGLAFGLPVTLLVDPDDCVVANMNGPAHWSGPDALALADALRQGAR
jgi:thiol-disulfide isomerase/thioredoxin